MHITGMQYFFHIGMVLSNIGMESFVKLCNDVIQDVVKQNDITSVQKTSV